LSVNNCVRFVPVCERQDSLEVLLKIFQSGVPIAIVADSQKYPIGAIRSHRLLDYLAQNLLLAPAGNWQIDRRQFLASYPIDLIESIEVLKGNSVPRKLAEIATNSLKGEQKLYAVVDDRQKFIGLLDDFCILNSVRTSDLTASPLAAPALEVSFTQGSSFLRQWKKKHAEEGVSNNSLPLDIGSDERTLQEFLLWLGHELKSPLTAIVGLSSLLRDAQLEQIEHKYAHYGDLIHRSGRRLMEIVNELFSINNPTVEIAHSLKKNRHQQGKSKPRDDRNWTILRLYPEEDGDIRDDFDMALNHFLSGLHHRILEADCLEQAEILARVWNIDAIVLNGTHSSDPVAYLRSFSRSDYLCRLPLIALDPKMTEAAKTIPTLIVYPYLLPIEEQYLNDVLQVIEIALG
jgi:hypothetical protein